MFSGFIIALIGFLVFVSPERFYADFFFASSFVMTCLIGGLLTGIIVGLISEKKTSFKEILFSVGGTFGFVALGQFFVLWYSNYREFFVTSYSMVPWWFTGGVILGIFFFATVISGVSAFLTHFLIRSKV
jgi:hypothetical protein